MKILFIDTSTSHINISIIEDNVILFQHCEMVEKDMSSKIVPLIDTAFQHCLFEPSELDKILVVNGPGSFTGIRIGVTVAKIMAWSLQIDVIPVSSLECIASTKSNKKYNVAIIDARRGNVFAGIYDQELNNILEDQLISYEQLLNFVNDDYEQISYDYDFMIDPNIDLLKVINKHLNDLPINPHLLNPNYLKKTEAEEKLYDKAS